MSTPAEEFARQQGLMTQVFQALNVAQATLRQMPPSREGSLAMTKIDEAGMWAERIPAPQMAMPDPTSMSEPDVPVPDQPNG
jgi:hypothetical protein